MQIHALRGDQVQAEVAALRPTETGDRQVATVVAGILAEVRVGGDKALVEITARLDWPGVTAGSLEVPPAELEAARSEVDPSLLSALQTARDNLVFFHTHERRAEWEAVGPQGQVLGLRYRPVRRAGLYVPGGRGAYASTVLMNAVPAQVAGVEELIICTPPGRDGSVDRGVLAAASLVGVTRVFRVGGAQAVAAMAYGTETVPRVDVICGPGNAFVMEAKRQVYGAVGIDSLAGPSEVLVIADHTARPDWVAVDLLAQEEHGSGAQAVLLADSEELCLAVAQAVETLRQMESTAAKTPGVGAEVTPRSAGLCGDHLHAFFPAPGEDFEALAEALVAAYAPEHLELQVAEPRRLFARVGPAGAVFLGHYAPTAFGDYVAGSNHVLPTGGSARFSGPLSVDVFLRRSSYVELNKGSATKLSGPLSTIAESEGFVFHRRSAEMRSEGEE